MPLKTGSGRLKGLEPGATGPSASGGKTEPEAPRGKDTGGGKSGAPGGGTEDCCPGGLGTWATTAAGRKDTSASSAVTEWRRKCVFMASTPAALPSLPTHGKLTARQGFFRSQFWRISESQMLLYFRHTVSDSGRPVEPADVGAQQSFTRLTKRRACPDNPIIFGKFWDGGKLRWQAQSITRPIGGAKL